MCELFDKIKQVLKGKNKFPEKDFDLKEGHPDRIENIEITCRKNISFKNDKYQYKFVEYTQWNRGEGKPWVAIGFNPAESDPGKIDGTNKKIIKALNAKGCNAYILLNLFPQVSDTKESFDDEDELNKEFPIILEEILNTIEDIDVLIFWGRTVPVPENIFKCLKKLIKKKHLKMTVKSGTSEHYHPARVPIDIKDVLKEQVKTAHLIV